MAQITEHTATVPSCPKPVFYLSAGPVDGPLIIFAHGWPELSISWRHQLTALGSLGFRCIAPDLRGYGRSFIPTNKQDVQHRYNVADLIGLLDHLSPGSQAVFVGHDWGGPVVWSLAMHHPDRVAGAAGLVVPHSGTRPAGSPTSVELYRAAEDAKQWDYQVLHNDEPAGVAAELDRDVRRTCTAIFQATYTMPPPRMWNSHISMFDQRERYRTTGGSNAFFVTADERGAGATELSRDTRMVSEADLNRYVEGLERNGGFTVPNFYYLNHAANDEFNREGVHHGGVLKMPTLIITAEYDTVCTPELSAKMDEVCTNLTRAHVYCGHWAQQERPADVNAALVRWLAASLPWFWPAPAAAPPPSKL